ncbi:uncharacterized protein LOC134718660 isoform X1 [Mytilus trossulus]|uniref:uncharacterized protein LOC134718660 isoform X1 n=1 Tax=Mytilus trossulus TaxID=6551 RepID=UPI0030041EB7
MVDSVMADYFGNPGSPLLHLNHRYMHAIGNSRARDLSEECKIPDKPEFLVLGGGDIRHVLYTVSQMSQLQKPPSSISMYLNDSDDVVLARNILLLKILETCDSNDKKTLSFLWSVWYNTFLTPLEHTCLKDLIHNVQQKLPECVEYAEEYSLKDIDKVFKYWSENLKINSKKIKKDRDSFVQKYVSSEYNEETTYHTAIECLSAAEASIFCIMPGCTLFKKRLAELKSYVVSGVSSSAQTDTLNRVNVTLLCPHSKEWRVEPSGTPFHAYNHGVFIPSLTMRENCMEQLKQWVAGWRKFINNGGKLQIKIFHGEPLTVCNCVLSADQRFDFIDTSYLCDDVGLMNLLLSCSHSLKRDGLLTVQSVKWTESFYTNFEDYLQDNLKASPGFYPMMFGLCLAEDFTLGTCNPARPNVHFANQTRKNIVKTRWKSSLFDNGQTVDIHGSLELLNVFKLIVDTAFDCELSPVMNLCGSGLILPLTVIYLIRSMQQKVKGGAECLLDLIEKRLPVVASKSGQDFKPSELEWRELRHQFFPDIKQPEAKEPLIVVEIEEFYNPNDKFPCTAGIKRPYQLFIFSTIHDKMAYIAAQCKSNKKQLSCTSQPWSMLSLMKYEPTKQTLGFLCPQKYYENFNVMLPLVLSPFYNAIPSLMCRNCIYDDDLRGYSFDTEVFRYNGFPNNQKEVEEFEVKDENDNTEKEDIFNVETCEAERFYNIILSCKKPNIEVTDLSGGVTEDNKYIIQYSVQYNLPAEEETRIFSGSIMVAHPVTGKIMVLHKTNKYIRAEIGKDFKQLEGPQLVSYRQIKVSNYPKLKWDMQRLVETLNGMFDTTRQMQRKGMIAGGSDKAPDYFVEFKNTLQIILFWVKSPPVVRSKVCSYSLIRDKRMVDPTAGRHRDQECGKYPDEIFLAVTGEHEVDGKMTLKVVWIDFEIYNKLEAEGKVAKGSHLKFMRKYWYDDEDKSHPMGNTAEAARIFQTVLRINSMKCVQGGDNGSGVWNFISFLQPVYTVGEKDKATKEGMFEKNFPKIQNHPLAVFHTRCHVCSTPVGRGMKECTDCRAVQYCTQECYDKDSQSHAMYCSKSVKGAKIMRQFKSDQAATETRKKERCSECTKKKLELKRCSRCKMAAYCNQACQKKHWPKHKKVCKS